MACTTEQEKSTTEQEKKSTTEQEKKSTMEKESTRWNHPGFRKPIKSQ